MPTPNVAGSTARPSLLSATVSVPPVRKITKPDIRYNNPENGSEPVPVEYMRVVREARPGYDYNTVLNMNIDPTLPREFRRFQSYVPRPTWDPRTWEMFGAKYNVNTKAFARKHGIKGIHEWFTNAKEAEATARGLIKFRGTPQEEDEFVYTISDGPTYNIVVTRGVYPCGQNECIDIQQSGVEDAETIHLNLSDRGYEWDFFKNRNKFELVVGGRRSSRKLKRKLTRRKGTRRNVR